MTDHITLDGTIVAAHGRSWFTVALDDDRTITAQLSGKLQRPRAPKVVAGDRVRVRFSPYDLERGQVCWRYAERRAA